MEIVIDIAPTGRVKCLYTEAIDLAALGELSMRRASHVEWNSLDQQWEVYLADLWGNKTGDAIYSNASRDLCLQWEREYFNERL